MYPFWLVYVMLIIETSIRFIEEKISSEGYLLIKQRSLLGICWLGKVASQTSLTWKADSARLYSWPQVCNLLNHAINEGIRARKRGLRSSK